VPLATDPEPPLLGDRTVAIDGRAILIREPRRSYIAERAAVGIRPGAGDGDPAAARRANPPGAGARADSSVADRDLDADGGL
jgi:hypothetical protein